MSDETQPQNPPETQPVNQPDPTADERPRGLRHRVLGVRAVAAVALASLVLGGLGGAALGAVASRTDQDGGYDGRGPGGQLQQGPPAGGLPPGTAPQDDVAPETGSDTGTDTGTDT